MKQMQTKWTNEYNEIAIPDNPQYAKYAKRTYNLRVPKYAPGIRKICVQYMQNRLVSGETRNNYVHLSQRNTWPPEPASQTKQAIATQLMPKQGKTDALKNLTY